VQLLDSIAYRALPDDDIGVDRHIGIEAGGNAPLAQQQQQLEAAEGGAEGGEVLRVRNALTELQQRAQAVEEQLGCLLYLLYWDKKEKKGGKY
jgi:hypothetical protein